MGLINFSGGLSAMGQSIAETAGVAGLNAQKADLEMQKDQLASQLAEGRETRLAGVKAGYDAQSDSRRDTAAMDRLHVTESGARDRQDALHKNNLDEISARSKAQISAAAAVHGMDLNDLSWIETDDATGTKFGVSKSGKKIDLGITGPNAADEKLLARAERFAQRTVVNPETQEKTTEIDETKAADFLARQGRDDLAKGYKTPKAPVAPPAPKGVPAGSQYSPSRQQWRDSSGKLYDANGAPVGGGGGARKSDGIINGLPIGGGG